MTTGADDWRERFAAMQAKRATIRNAKRERRAVIKARREAGLRLRYAAKTARLSSTSCRHCGQTITLHCGQFWLDGDGWFRCAKDINHEPGEADAA